METYLRHRPTERKEKILKLAAELKDKGFMVDNVDKESSAVSQRWEYLDAHQSKKRLDLEESISDAQQCEQLVLRVVEWFSQVDNQLEKLLVDDILAEDVPYEVDVSIFPEVRGLNNNLFPRPLCRNLNKNFFKIERSWQSSMKVLKTIAHKSD